MNIHEYQAKELLRQAGIPVQPGEVATTSDEAEAIARRTDGAVVVKAQVHAGGRGKAGGVKLAKTPAEARAAAERILGMSIKGLVVQRVLVAQAADIACGVVRRHHRRSSVEATGRDGQSGGWHGYRGSGGDDT